MVEPGKPDQIRLAHLNYYGFDVSEQWATDLAAYVQQPAHMPRMLQGDVESVKRSIKSVYGFDVTDEYAADLMAFAEKGEKK